METKKIIESAADFFAHSASDDDYIYDVIAEFCDSAVPVYNGQLLEFVSDDPKSLADVVDDGLYDPSQNYDFFRHAACAYFFTCERVVYENLDSIMLSAFCCNNNYTDEQRDAIADTLENVDHNLTISELWGMAREAIAEEQ